MTQPAAQQPAQIHSQPSINVRALVLRRAEWESEVTPRGPAIRPQKETWFGYVLRGSRAHQVAVVPLIGCPNCGGLIYLSPSEPASRWLSGLFGVRIPVAHAVDSMGKVTPDVLCGKCDFHRKIYLDRWQNNKPLYAIAYVDGAHGEIRIDHCNAVDSREALFHFGKRPTCRVIGVGKAVGFFVDEKTGRVTAD